MTEKTVSSLSIFALFSKESPVDGYSSRISMDWLRHTPDQQSENQVKHDDKNQVWFWLQWDHELVDVDEVVKCDETTYADEMGIQKAAAHRTVNIIQLAKLFKLMAGLSQKISIEGSKELRDLIDY